MWEEMAGSDLQLERSLSTIRVLERVSAMYAGGIAAVGSRTARSGVADTQLAVEKAGRESRGLAMMTWARLGISVERSLI